MLTIQDLSRETTATYGELVDFHHRRGDFQPRNPPSLGGTGGKI